MSLHDVRRDYSGDALPQDLTSFEPWKFFTDWLDAAIAADEVEPTPCCWQLLVRTVVRVPGWCC